MTRRPAATPAPAVAVEPTRSAEGLVEAVFTEVLGRRMEPAQRAWADSIPLEAFDPKGFLQSILDSPEFAQLGLKRLIYKVVGRSALAEQPEWISLGTQCITAEILRSAQRRRFSSPFDWIFASPRMVLHILQDDFATFMDAAHHRPTERPIHERPSARAFDHDWYRLTYGVEWVFNHHDMTQDWGRSFFERATARFRARLQSGAPARLLMLTGDHSADVAFADELAQTVKAISPHAETVVVKCEPHPSVSPPLVRAVRGGRHITFYAFDQIGPQSFNDVRDDVGFARLLADVDDGRLDG